MRRNALLSTVRERVHDFLLQAPARDLVYVEVCADKSTALRRELAIKRLPKKAKEQLLLAQSNQLLGGLGD